MADIEPGIFQQLVDAIVAEFLTPEDLETWVKQRVPEDNVNNILLGMGFTTRATNLLVWSNASGVGMDLLQRLSDHPPRGSRRLSDAIYYLTNGRIRPTGSLIPPSAPHDSLFVTQRPFANRVSLRAALQTFDTATPGADSVLVIEGAKQSGKSHSIRLALQCAPPGFRAVDISDWGSSQVYAWELAGAIYPQAAAELKSEYFDPSKEDAQVNWLYNWLSGKLHPGPHVWILLDHCSHPNLTRASSALAEGNSGSPALSTFFGDDFSDNAQQSYLAAVREWLASEDGQKRVSEALSLSDGLHECLKRTSEKLVGDFVDAIRECCNWYGDRWRVYKANYETARALGLPGQRAANYWAYQIQKWQEQLVINQLPRLGLLPSYSFPVSAIQLEVLTSDRPRQNMQPWENDIQLNRDARLGIAEYAPGAQVVANGRVWESYGVGQYPRHFMATRFYFECPSCRHVQKEEASDSFPAACIVCGMPIRKVNVRAFLEPRSFVTSSEYPNGRDPGLVRLKPPPAQEARLLTAAPEDEFRQKPTNVPATSWAFQSTGRGQMFVVNKGRGHGFLRCRCGFAELVKHPGDVMRIQREHNRTPFDQPCPPDQRKWENGGRPEDFVHIYNTDVLQIRLDRALPPAPSDLTPDQAALWPEAMLRTLVEAVRLGAASVLGVEQRDIAGTSRVRAFGYPEVVLYDSAAGGAGYCQLLQKHGLRALLESAVQRLDCPEDCSHSCRTCLRSYDNQLHWDAFIRKPVIGWLRHLLSEKEKDNPFADRNAVRIDTADPDQIWLGALESPGWLILLVAQLFPASDRDDDAGNEQKSPAAARLDRIAAWMHQGGKLDIGLDREPLVSTDQPHTIRFARILAPHLHSGHLKLFRLPSGIDPAGLSRVAANPGKASSLALFTAIVSDSNPLQTVVSLPAWQSPSADTALVAEMMQGWQQLPVTALDLPPNITVQDYNPGQARDHARDFAFAKGKEFQRLTINDPFALKTESNASCLLDFLRSLDKLWKKFPALILLRTRHAPDSDQSAMEANLKQFVQTRGSALKLEKIPAFGPGRRDLHHRRLVFTTAAKTPKQIEVLLTGGIDRYMQSRFETSVVVRRT